MGWFDKKQTNEETAENLSADAAPVTKKISLNFRGLSAQTVRDICETTLNLPAVMPAVPDMRGLAANDNLSSVFNAAAAFTSPVFQQGRRKPSGPKP